MPKQQTHCGVPMVPWYGPGMLALPPMKVCVKCGEKREVQR